MTILSLNKNNQNLVEYRLIECGSLIEDLEKLNLNTMIEYRVTKKYLDADEDEGFFVERLKGPDNKDLTKKIDTDTLFEDDDDLVDYLAEVFNEDADDIQVVEEELKVEFSGNPDKLDPDGAGMIQG